MSDSGKKDMMLREKARYVLQQFGEKRFDPTVHDDIHNLVEELNIYHIELEMQNEELRRTQDYLEENRQYLRRLFDGAPVGYIVLDRSGIIQDINRTAAGYFCYKKEILIGQKLQSFIHADSVLVYTKQLKNLADTGIPQRADIRFYNRNRVNFWVRMDIAFRDAPEDKKQMILGSLSDISKEKAAEEVLCNAQKSLEEEVRSRTRELTFANKYLMNEIREHMKTEERLNRTLAELAYSNKELETFFYVASHDLQEPLRKIQAFGKILQTEEDCLSDKGRDILGRIQKAAARMRQLLEDILHYSRLIRKENLSEPIDLNEIIENVQKEMGEDISTSGAQIDIEKLPAVSGHPEHMRYLFKNLLSNALKYHKKGNIPIIRIRARHTDEKTCKIEVSDNGIGFDEKYLDRIFKPFQRLHRRDEFSGTGMGLAICQKIMNLQGGKITAKSSPGNGATFILTFVEGA
jgi:PAS domain S-box-containing protein